MAQSLRRVVLAAVMALVVLLFTSGARMSRAIVVDEDMSWEMVMPPIPRVEGLAVYDFTAAQRTNTLKMLQAFADAMPALKSLWTGSSFCDWEGVSCYQNSVYLSPLSLSFTGTLPDVPADVDGPSVRLDTVSFYNLRSSVSGTLPDSWSRLTYLRTLNLASTSVSGSLPASWSSLRRLYFLAVYSTSVSGTLPPQWASLTQLTSFGAYGTQITGVLPSEWSTLPELQMIQLQRCHLVGSLPASWGYMPKLDRMALTGNNFCGCVPNSWKASAMRVAIESKYSASNCATALMCVPTTTTTTPAPTTSTSTTTTTTTPAPTTSTSTTTTTTTPAPTTSTSTTTTTTTPAPTTSTSTTTTTHRPSTPRPSTFAAMMKAMCNNTRNTPDAQLNTYKKGICCSDYNITNDAWKCGDAIFDMLDATVNCSAPKLNADFKCCANVDEYGNRDWVGWSCNGANGVVSALAAVAAVIAVVVSSAM